MYVGLFFCFYSFAHAQESDVNLECKGWKTGDAPRACSVEGEGGTVQVVGTCIADGKCKGVYYIKDGVKCFIGTNYCGQLPASSVQNSSGQILTLPTDLGGGLESALPPPTTIESPQVGGANSTYAPPSYTDIGNFETETFTESGSSAGNTEASTQPDLRTNTFLSERWAEGKIETLQVSPDLTPAAGMSGLPEVSENPFSLGSPSVHNDDPLAFGDDLLAESQTLSDGTKLQILEQRVSSAQKLVDETQSALSVYSDPQNSYAISYEGLPPAQDAADRATAALEAAQTIWPNSKWMELSRLVPVPTQFHTRKNKLKKVRAHSHVSFEAWKTQVNRLQPNLSRSPRKSTIRCRITFGRHIHSRRECSTSAVLRCRP